MPPPEESASTGSVPRSIPFTSHFLIPSPMTVKGDLVNNWEFFKQQWTDYEVATGLDKQEQKIRLATFRSAMGKECLQIFLNLKLTTEEQQDTSSRKGTSYTSDIFLTCANRTQVKPWIVMSIVYEKRPLPLSSAR